MNEKNNFFSKILAPIESITFSPPVEYIIEPGNSVSGNFNQKNFSPPPPPSPPQAPATPTLPKEIIIQSSPIQTELNDGSSYNTAESLVTDTPSQISLENERLDSATPTTNGNKLSGTNTRLSDQQQLIDFIQKLMSKAKAEQEKMKTKSAPPVELQLDIQKVDLSNFSPISISKFPQMNLEDFVSPVTEGTVGSLQIRQQPTTTTTTAATTTTTTTTVRTTATTERERSPVLPFRTTVRTVSTTTEDGTPSGVITKLLSEAAAPIAGLSAATLAYSAAAMLPVWLPAALGRKRRSFQEPQIEINKILNLPDLPDLQHSSKLSV